MSTKRSRRYLLLIGAYLLMTLLLGLRPKWDRAYRWAYGTHWGAYNMFTASVTAEESAWLEGPRGQRISINHSLYRWNNPLINTTHSHVDPAVLERLVQFLAARPEIIELVPAATATQWRAVLTLRYRRNREPAKTLTATCRLTTSTPSPDETT